MESPPPSQNQSDKTTRWYADSILDSPTARTALTENAATTPKLTRYTLTPPGVVTRDNFNVVHTSLQM